MQLRYTNSSNQTKNNFGCGDSIFDEGVNYKIYLDSSFTKCEMYLRYYDALTFELDSNITQHHDIQ